MRPTDRGFTAIELVTVTAVTLVMVALAVSAYRTYSVRREVSESLAAAVPIQALVAHTFYRTGVPPASERDVPGLHDALRLSANPPAVAINQGRIEIRFGNDAARRLRGRSLHLTPFETADGAVSWLCGFDIDTAGLYPLGFLGGTTVPVESVTTVEPRFLPLECR